MKQRIFTKVGIFTLIRIHFILILSVLFLWQTAFAQGVETKFGKNRVQFHDFEWSFYETDNFIVYFYQGGNDIAKYVLQIAEESVQGIETRLEYNVSEKIEILTYHNLSDLKQTNLGIGQEFNNIGGVTKLVGNKLFVYFNGDHNHLKEQVTTGISKVVLDNVVFGVTIQEILQNAVLLDLPEWFTSGLVAFSGQEWTPEKDNLLRYGVLNRQFKKINKLDHFEATIVGESIWRYISRLYGETSIPNIIYLTRVHRSIDSGLQFVIGKDSKELFVNWYEYHYQLYLQDQELRADFEADKNVKSFKNKRNEFTIDHLEVSPDGSKMLYAVQDEGKYKVYLYDFETQKRKKILKSGYRAFNLPKEIRYPIFAWHRSSNSYTVIYENKDKILLHNKNISNGELYEDEITRFDQVIEACYTGSDKRLVVSAVKSSQTDLYTYYIPNQKIRRLTKDYYDDLDISYVMDNDYEGVLFSSNRPNEKALQTKYDSISDFQHYDVYYYDIRRDKIGQITRNSNYDEIESQYIGNGEIGFISEANGIRNLFVTQFDTTLIDITTKYNTNDSLFINPNDELIAFIDSTYSDVEIVRDSTMQWSSEPRSITNLNYGIEHWTYATKVKQAFYQFFNPKYYHWTKEKIKTPYQTAQTAPLRQNRSIIEQRNEVFANDQEEQVMDDTSPLELMRELGILYPPYEFAPSEIEDTIATDVQSYLQNDFQYFSTEWVLDSLLSTAGVAQISTFGDQVKSTNEAYYKQSRIRVYQTRMAVDNIVTQLDNSNILTPYESFDLAVQGNFAPNFAGMFKVGITDLLEDYKIVGGFRVPFNFQGSEYFVELQNLKKRVDKSVLYYRRAAVSEASIFVGNTSVTARAKTITNLFQVSFSYPLEMIKSIRLYGTLRSDKLVLQSIEPYSLLLGDMYTYVAQTKVEYVHDDTREIQLNILEGLRFKVYGEFLKPFTASIKDSLDISFKGTGNTVVIGTDFRYYFKIHRNIIWANRFASASSIGPNKIIYYLGGIEGWLSSLDNRFDNNTPVNRDNNYKYQAQASNVRGHKINVRNGSNFALLNSELRIPVFSYLINSPIRSEFFKNFQVNLFFDSGLAWDGTNPFSEENKYYELTFPDPTTLEPDENPPVIVDVRFYKDPLVYGYGGGIRSILLGYFVKLDMGYGIDNGYFAKKPIWYFSLGKDF